MQNKLALATFGRTTLSAALALAFGASLAACGGGSSSDDTPQAAAPARIVSVVAATGKAAAGSTVNVYDASKERVGFGATDASGQANIAITAGAKAPFLVTATTASGTVLSAVSLKERTINLTQLTSIITTQLLGATPAAATAASLAAVDAAKLQAAQTRLGKALAAPLQTLGMAASYDFVNGPLTPSSKDPADVLLDNLQVKTNGTDVDIVNASGSIVAQILNGGAPMATGKTVLETPPVLTARQQILAATAAGTDAAPVFLQVSLDELRPTQPAIGYDQVYYKLGRYGAEDLIMAKTNKPKKFAELCEANGQDDVVTKTANIAGATLINPPASFQCKSPVGTKPGDMKTVVIGPNGTLYLTDGHHTFSAFWDADNGVNHQLKVWVKVTDNFSKLGEYDFWAQMKKASKVWLKNGTNQAIATSQLPAAIGLKSLGNDPYRALVYFTRDAGYVVPSTATEFLEFYWANWLRNKPVVDLSKVDTSDTTAYMAAIKTASQAMVALKATDIVSGTATAQSLGWTGVFSQAALDDLVTPTGKLTYSIAYKKSLVK
ncbi:ParB-like protein [Janthinobacterium sp. J1-1]|uniref:ParB-like protein n=1 Tax=Janthinobacterium sp. J1-1 TaxID=3065910 RepID=UPI002810BDE3|nr:ParB-like protein [Janthinobacterium sp. J1-1]